MSLPVRIRCPFLEQSKDISRLGQMQPETVNFFEEVNAALSTMGTQAVKDEGSIANDYLYLHANPTIGDTVLVGAETWEIVETRAAAFEVTRGANTDATITNLVAAVNLDTAQDIVATAVLSADMMLLQGADAPGGNPVPGAMTVALDDTLTDVQSQWALGNLSYTGRDIKQYQSHISVEAAVATLAAAFPIKLPFTPTEIRFRSVNADGLALPSRTAVAAILGDDVIVDLSAGGDPLQAGEFLQLDIYGSELV